VSELETSAVKGQRDQAGAAPLIFALALIAGLILLPYLPLLLAGMETVTLGTNWVEDSCQKLGIHEELSAFYKATIFRWSK
jgi:hypothetical protein